MRAAGRATEACLHMQFSAAPADKIEELNTSNRSSSTRLHYQRSPSRLFSLFRIAILISRESPVSLSFSLFLFFGVGGGSANGGGCKDCGAGVFNIGGRGLGLRSVSEAKY